MCGGQAGVGMGIDTNCLGVLQTRGPLWARETIWGRKMDLRMTFLLSFPELWGKGLGTVNLPISGALAGSRV